MAITPDAKGKGGSFDCVGRCIETVPGNGKVKLSVGTFDSTCFELCVEKDLWNIKPTERVCTARCDMHDEFAGNKGSKTPHGYFQVKMLEDGHVTSLTPEADLQYCEGKGCNFVQGYRDAKGNGGFGYCDPGSGGTCLGETSGRPEYKDGKKVSDGVRKYIECSKKSCDGPAVLLYPNRHDIDKYGPNEGWYCGKGAGGNGCKSNDYDHMTMGRGEAQPSWMPLFDPDYTRPAQDTKVDKQMAKDLKKFGVKEGDPLPPLSPAALADLERTNPDAAKRYRQELRPLTAVEKAFTAARAASAESNAQYVKDQGNKELPGLRKILDKVRKAGSTDTLSKHER
ncbi:MAG: hypothetical protein ACRDXB_17750, partial [Actinomycetes bacterium]